MTTAAPKSYGTIGQMFGEVWDFLGSAAVTSSKLCLFETDTNNLGFILADDDDFFQSIVTSKVYLFYISNIHCNIASPKTNIITKTDLPTHTGILPLL